TEPDFKEFDRKRVAIDLVTMTHYIDGLKAEEAFPPQSLANTFGAVVSKLGRTQLRIAETEKYPHVTFFFSGGQETPFEGESRVMIPSPRDVPTYDKKPEMSARGITDAFIEELKKGPPDAIVCNFANPDMVGHTGIVEAAVKACETVDECLGRVIPEILSRGGAAVVTADHGNSEELWNFEANAPHTQHTTNPVRLIVVDDSRIGAKLRSGGRLADVSPTLLDLMGAEQPADMEGVSLLKNA
ncbi:MAG: alkaline phosphatase family protein, partial [Candidatus Sumerlaeaceae bacterium]|nr:alkaline phosphatase family protein [Candidatus Sumerlaeaceae bacterium]